MAQPTTYTRQADFSDFSTNYPTTPHSGVNLDAEFDAVRTTLLAILVNLALIQRDDGDLANGSVGIDQLASDVEMGFRTISNWTTATDYRLRDGVFKSGILYRCIVRHTAGTFSTDLAAAYWTEVYDFTTAAGYVIGTDIQAWDQQLDDIAALTPTDSVVMVGNGTTWVGESGATLRTSLGLTIGTDVQAYNAALASIAGLTTAADKMIYATSSNTYAVIDLTAAGRALLDDADASAQRTTLGLGSIATQAADNVAITGGTFAGTGAFSVTRSVAGTTWFADFINTDNSGGVAVRVNRNPSTGAIITGILDAAGGGAFVRVGSTTDHPVQLMVNGIRQAQIASVASAVEYVQLAGATTGGVPTVSAQGAATDLDLGLTPKGTGLVRFGAFTADGAISATGSISVKASNGTTYKLLCVAA